MSYKRTCITVDDDLYNQAQAEAAQTGDSFSAICRMALRQRYMTMSGAESHVTEAHRRIANAVLREVRVGLDNALQAALATVEE